MQIEASRVQAFREALDRVAGERLEPEDLQPKLTVDLDLPLAAVTPELWRVLAHFGPFGQGNPKPVFLARNVGLRGAPQIVGEDHLRLRLDTGESAVPEAIAFGQAAEAEWMTESSRIDLAYHLGLKSWQGVEYIQARVVDLRPSEAVGAASES